MIDASSIYTAQRAQNIMTDADIQKVFSLYQAYENKVDFVKIATIDEIKSKGYTLAINNYIEKQEQKTVSPEEVRRQYFAAYEEMLENEKKFQELLLKGGYVRE